MGTIQNTNWDRTKRHVLKKAAVTLHGLRPSGLRGRFVGPRVLLNSVPKAGTHLVENALEQLPFLRNAGKRTLDAWDHATPRVIDAILSIRKGEFVNAHLPAHPEVLDGVRRAGVRTIMVVRDPRDIVVSRYRYVVSIDRTHKEGAYLRSLKDNDERLMASIAGVPDIISPIDEILTKFEPWLSSELTYVCKFEDLIGAKGGGDVDTQVKALEGIASFLGIELEHDQIRRIASKVFSTKSSTFNKGKIGGWRDHFSPEHILLFKELAGEHLIRYGYESGRDW